AYSPPLSDSSAGLWVALCVPTDPPPLPAIALDFGAVFFRCDARIRAASLQMNDSHKNQWGSAWLLAFEGRTCHSAQIGKIVVAPRRDDSSYKSVLNNVEIF